MPQTPRVHIVDDDESFRVSTSRLLRAAGYDVQSYANAGAFLLAEVEDAPGCILLDFHMPGPSGLALQEELTNRSTTLPIIFLSGRADIPITVQAMKGGAVDFLTKPVKREKLIGAIETALTNYARERQIRLNLKTWRDALHQLTEREREVFERVVAGRLNKEIAAELGAAERTVKAHRAKVMQKMGVESLAELVQAATALRSSGESI